MLRCILCVLILYLGTQFSYAGIVITGTRVIYPASQKSVNVQLTNTGNHVSLVQSWIDNGDENTPPEYIKTPFIITPPITRIDEKKGQTLRLTYTGEPLPNDRESVFYLNVLDIPPKPQATPDGNNNYLQIAVRTRIKLFFRPEGLSPIAEAYARVKFAVAQQQGKYYLMVDNPTPYHITYNSIQLKGSHTVKVPQADMVAPFSQVAYPLNQQPSAKAEVDWLIVNDYGALLPGKSRLQ